MSSMIRPRLGVGELSWATLIKVVCEKAGCAWRRSRGEGANVGFLARNEATSRETAPRVPKIKVAENMGDTQKSPTQDLRERTRFTRKMGCPTYESVGYFRATEIGDEGPEWHDRGSG